MAQSPVYLVDAHSDPVVLRVEGRACFQNSAGLKEFTSGMIKQGKTRFVFDLQHCASMDSTFLGVLAGSAMELRKATKNQGSFILARVGQRNLELLRNMGLHRIMTVDCGDFQMNFDKCNEVLAPEKLTELENARMMLSAHENLISADEKNRTKFQDVLDFMKNRVEQG
jgi:anti-sigma B factor antagonist